MVVLSLSDGHTLSSSPARTRISAFGTKGYTIKSGFVICVHPWKVCPVAFLPHLMVPERGETTHPLCFLCLCALVVREQMIEFREFMMVLAICHSVVPTIENGGGNPV